MENLVKTFIEEKLSIYNFAKKYKLEQEYVIKTLILQYIQKENIIVLPVISVMI